VGNVTNTKENEMGKPVREGAMVLVAPSKEEADKAREALVGSFRMFNALVPTTIIDKEAPMILVIHESEYITAKSTGVWPEKPEDGITTVNIEDVGEMTPEEHLALGLRNKEIEMKAHEGQGGGMKITHHAEFNGTDIVYAPSADYLCDIVAGMRNGEHWTVNRGGKCGCFIQACCTEGRIIVETRKHIDAPISQSVAGPGDRHMAQSLIRDYFKHYGLVAQGE